MNEVVYEWKYFLETIGQPFILICTDYSKTEIASEAVKSIVINYAGFHIVGSQRKAVLCWSQPCPTPQVIKSWTWATIIFKTQECSWSLLDWDLRHWGTSFLTILGGVIGLTNDWLTSCSNVWVVRGACAGIMMIVSWHKIITGFLPYLIISNE